MTIISQLDTNHCFLVYSLHFHASLQINLHTRPFWWNDIISSFFGGYSPTVLHNKFKILFPTYSRAQDKPGSEFVICHDKYRNARCYMFDFFKHQSPDVVWHSKVILRLYQSRDKQYGMFDFSYALMLHPATSFTVTCTRSHISNIRTQLRYSY